MKQKKSTIAWIAGMSLFSAAAVAGVLRVDYAMGSVWVLCMLIAAAVVLGLSLRYSPLPSWTPWLFAFALSLACIMANAQFGLNLLDEGFSINTLDVMQKGGVIYSDTSSILTPGLFFAAFPIVKIFGLSIWTLRWFMGFLMALVCAGSGVIVYRMTKHPLAAAATWLAVLSLCAGVWFVFFTYGWLAIVFGLLALFFLHKHFTDCKPLWAALSGVALALAGLTKQTLGVYFMAAMLAAVVFEHFAARKSLWAFFKPFASALFGCVAAFLVYLLFTGSLSTFVEQCITLPLTSFSASTILPPALSQIQNSFAWTTDTAAYAFLFYAHAAIVVAGAVVFVYRLIKKNPDANLGLLLFFAMAAILQNFERASINKGRTSFVFALLLFGYLLYLAAKKTRHWALAGGSMLMLFCGMLGGMRLDAVWFQTYSVPWEKVAPVRVSGHDAARLPGIIQEIEQATRPGEYVFIYPASSLLYYLADIQDPTRYKNVIVGSVNEAAEREIINALETRQVQFALYDEIFIDGLAFFEYAPRIDAYIKQNFEEYRRFNDNTVLLKRK